MRIILASASPARLATLQAAGIQPDVIISGVNEDQIASTDAANLAAALAQMKCRAVADQVEMDALVIGCDSVLAFEGEIFGKPAGPVDLDVATEKEIEALRHIGPTLAKRIVADRDSFGPFGSIDGLRRVKGVGPSMVEKLDSAVTFSLVPRPTNRVISRPSELPKARRKPHRRDMRP